MKKELKGFIIGVILTAMLASTVVFAGELTKSIEVVFNSVKLTVNGQKVAADTILYNGTTYVPLRATAEILGKYVGWDGATNTASINDKATENAVTKEEKPANSSSETLSQKNAISMAKKYLDYTAFSQSGLIKQLKFEGFTDGDATYAVNQINANWKEQAVIMARKYLDYTAFSKSGLIEQLEFEGFSSQDANYAVGQIGL